jgi:hypothetical protein
VHPHVRAGHRKNGTLDAQYLRFQPNEDAESLRAPNNSSMRCLMQAPDSAASNRWDGLPPQETRKACTN